MLSARSLTDPSRRPGASFASYRLLRGLWKLPWQQSPGLTQWQCDPGNPCDQQAGPRCQDHVLVTQAPASVCPHPGVTFLGVCLKCQEKGDLTPKSQSIKSNATISILSARHHILKIKPENSINHVILILKGLETYLCVNKWKNDLHRRLDTPSWVGNSRHFHDYFKK